MSVTLRVFGACGICDAICRDLYLQNGGMMSKELAT
jgi:hypothetical protein